MPVFAVIFLLLVTASGYGHQSLSHFIEISITLVASLIILYLRVFFIDKHKLNFRYNSYMVVGASLLFVILFKTFMTLELIHLIFR